MSSNDIYSIYHNSDGSLNYRISHFVQKSKAKFGDQFSYEFLPETYKNSKSKVTLVCKEHGKIQITATKHLHGKFGCYQCAMIGKGLSTRKGIPDSIRRFKEKHGDRYDYSLIENIEYHSIYQKVPIICHKHSPPHIFEQGINKHIHGRGCPICGQRDWLSFGFFQNHPEEAELPACVYLLKLKTETESFLKVGISKEPNNRFQAYRRTGFDVDVVFQHWDTYLKCYIYETTILNQNMTHLYIPEISFGGYTECLYETEEQNIYDQLTALTSL